MRTLTLWRVSAACAACAILVLSGCTKDPTNVDPWEKCNRFFYSVNDDLDRVALKPASDFYVKVVPEPARTGLGNAFDNLGYGNVILNDFLQAKWGQGLGDTGRMAANSTVGLAGIFDVATKWRLPAHKNDFGITLAKWGAAPGPYLVLPLFGPSSVRDAPGVGVAMVTNPLFWVDVPWTVTIPLDVVEAMSERSRADAEIRFRNQAAIDPYVFTRDAYLQYRRAQTHEGQPPPDEGFYDQDMGSAPPPASQPK